MIDKFNFKDQTPDALSTDGMKLGPDELQILKDCTESIKQSAEQLSENAKIATDTIESIGNVILMPDGKIVDFSDKEGRASLKEHIAANTKSAEELREIILNVVPGIKKSIPISVEAKLSDEDQKRFDKFQNTIIWSIIVAAIIGLFLGLLMLMAVNKNIQASQRYKEQSEVIDFGNFIKKRHPENFQQWKAAVEQVKTKRQNDDSADDE